MINTPPSSQPPNYIRQFNFRTSRVSHYYNSPQQNHHSPGEHLQSSVPQDRRLGTVKFFNSTKGFGFIVPELPLDSSGQQSDLEVFVHHTAITTPTRAFRSLAEGELVEFDLIHGPKGYFSQNVTGPNGSPVRGDPKVHHTIPRKSASHFNPHHHYSHHTNFADIVPPALDISGCETETQSPQRTSPGKPGDDAPYAGPQGMMPVYHQNGMYFIMNPGADESMYMHPVMAPYMHHPYMSPSSPSSTSRFYPPPQPPYLIPVPHVYSPMIPNSFSSSARVPDLIPPPPHLVQVPNYPGILRTDSGHEHGLDQFSSTARSVSPNVAESGPPQTSVEPMPSLHDDYPEE